MRLSLILISTHVLACMAGVLLVVLAQPHGSIVIWGASGASAILAVVLALLVLFLAHWGLGRIAPAVTAQDTRQAFTGIRELDDVIRGLREIARRWSDAVSRARQEGRDIQELLNGLERRQGETAISGQEAPFLQLRKLLHGLLSSTADDLEQLTSQLGEIERFVQRLSQVSEGQGDAVSKSVGCVAQISERLDSVSGHTHVARQATLAILDTARVARGAVHEASRGLESLQHRADRAERKLRLLADRSRQISGIVDLIVAISARTDLMALNASIESLRAGELGRGFSIVAEEVRKLAEQTSQAAREVATLVETIQADANDSITTLNEQSAQLHVETDRLQTTAQRLGGIEQSCESSTGAIRDLTQVIEHQLRISQDLVLAMEQISDSARQNRGQAEQAHFTARSAAKLVGKVSQRLAPITHLLPKRSVEVNHRESGIPASPISEGEQLERILQAVTPLDASPSEPLMASGI